MTDSMINGLVQAAYIVAAVLFIAALAGLSKHESAKAGNLAGMVGMLIALAATITLARLTHCSTDVACSIGTSVNCETQATTDAALSPTGSNIRMESIGRDFVTSRLMTVS